MSDSGGHITQWFLRCAAPFVPMPAIGGLSAQIVPRSVLRHRAAAAGRSAGDFV
jgi:hypothetical protein